MDLIIIGNLDPNLQVLVLVLGYIAIGLVTARSMLQFLDQLGPIEGGLITVAWPIAWIVVFLWLLGRIAEVGRK